MTAFLSIVKLEAETLGQRTALFQWLLVALCFTVTFRSCLPYSDVPLVFALQ